ncbi:MAG: 3-isopropylmalate dehydratase small subunit, partial [Acidimicrobiia bacterium]|nr:3-isopropylmalate dehydratase small subunit [Acidimicrobiia bacterium]
IFYNNCINIGLLPVVLTDEEVAKLTSIAEDPDNVVTIDLHAQTVSSVGFDASFDIDPFEKHRLINGLDSIALTLKHDSVIGDYESARASHKPSLA